MKTSSFPGVLPDWVIIYVQGEARRIGADDSSPGIEHGPDQDGLLGSSLSRGGWHIQSRAYHSKHHQGDGYQGKQQDQIGAAHECYPRDKCDFSNYKRPEG